jgi:molybdopterin-containing oxidoreductase family membrane subunit
MVVVAAAEKVTGRELVDYKVFRKLGFISGVLLALYVVAKAVDTYIWLNKTSPAVGFGPWDYYSYKPVSSLALFVAIVICGLLPATIFVVPYTARKRGLLLSAAVLTCFGVLLNRFVMTVPTLALPTLSFDEFLEYTPSWQEFATFGAVIAYGVILYSLSYRYLPLFAQRKGAGKNVPVE